MNNCNEFMVLCSSRTHHETTSEGANKKMLGHFFGYLEFNSFVNELFYPSVNNTATNGHPDVFFTLSFSYFNAIISKEDSNNCRTVLNIT